MQGPEALRDLVERALDDLDLHPDLSGLETSMRYALDGGGKRIRPVRSIISICV